MIKRNIKTFSLLIFINLNFLTITASNNTTETIKKYLSLAIPCIVSVVFGSYLFEKYIEKYQQKNDRDILVNLIENNPDIHNAIHVIINQNNYVAAQSPLA